MSSRLKNLLLEGLSNNRVSLTRVESILENVGPQLEKKQQERLADAYVQLKILAESLNQTPYTTFNADHWKLLNVVLMGKVAELKLVVEDIAKDNKKVDMFPLARAIDTILI